jgi:hypothetical protein
MEESASSSDNVVREAGSITATGIASVSLGSFVLLAIIGVIIGVVFRR